jgi:hypothetical protein
MKFLLYILFAAVVVVAGILGYFAYNNNQLLQTAKAVIVSQDEDISRLNDENAKLVADNIKYMKQSNLKSFATAKDLERFLKADSTDQEYKDDYASVASIELMKNAREQGYWMGMSALNSTQENMLSAMLKERQGLGDNIQWVCYNVAIVGDAELYFIDPQNDTYALKIMVMSGDFLNYTGKTTNFQ